MPQFINNAFIIGDIHGCIDELREILKYKPKNATLISLGDVVDKHPNAANSAEALKILCEHGAKIIIGNHDDKYLQYYRKGTWPDKIGNEERKRIFVELLKAPQYLDYFKDKNNGYIYLRANLFSCVHGGIAPDFDLDNPNGETLNGVLRCRYVDKNTLKKVSTVHNADGTWGPEHPNVFVWQEVYDGRYGTIIHGHSVLSQNLPVFWRDGKECEQDSGEINAFNVISLDTGCVYGGHLSALSIENGKKFELVQVKAKAKYH